MTNNHVHTLACGGSFDHFHAGHRQFLSEAFEHCNHLIIGITNQAMIQRKSNPESLEPLSTRQAAVADFCDYHHYSYELSVLHDIFGPTLESETIDGIWVTTETKPGADLINKLRTERGKKALPIQQSTMALDETGVELHSDRIRAGIVDREGKLWLHTPTAPVQLTPSMREFLSQPLGVVSPSTSEFQVPTDAPIMVVGDTSLETFITQNWPYQIGIYDQMRQREPATSAVIDTLTATQTVLNPAGQITPELVATCSQLLSKQAPTLLHITGEEDLAAVVLLLLAPLNWYLVYGQPNQGLVTLQVSESMKARLRDWWNQIKL